MFSVNYFEIILCGEMTILELNWIGDCDCPERDISPQSANYAKYIIIRKQSNCLKIRRRLPLIMRLKLCTSEIKISKHKTFE